MRPILLATFALTISLIPILGLAESGDSCPITSGSDKFLGPPFPEAENWYGKESLAVILPANGLWPTTKSGHLMAVKLFWWSLGFEPGMESNLSVDIRSLNGKPVRAKINKPTNAHSESLGGWTMMTGIDFPDPGCWQISGEYLGQILTFVVETVDVDEYLRRASQ